MCISRGISKPINLIDLGIFPDQMHIVHLAVATDAITSCLLDWSDNETLVGGSSREKRLTQLWESYFRWCEAQRLGERSQRKLFTPGTLKPDAGQYVEVSQKVINATAARYMLFWLASMARQFSNMTNADADMYLGYLYVKVGAVVSFPQMYISLKMKHLRYRAGVACGLVQMELVCLRGKRKLSNAEWLRLEEGYLVYRAASMKMSELALQQKVCRWRQRPKGHALEHLVYDFNQRNPRYLNNYLDEDFVRRSKRLALTATPKYVSQHVVLKYAVAATLRWSGLDS